MKYHKHRNYRDQAVVEVETVTKTIKKIVKEKNDTSLIKRLFKKVIGNDN